MTDEPFEVDGAPRHTVPFGIAPLVAVVLLVGVGVVVGAVRGYATLPVPKKDVPAFRVLTAADLEQQRVREPLPDGVVTDAKALVGRVTRQDLAKGDPVQTTAVTGPVNLSGYHGPLIKLRPAHSTVLGVNPGDAVVLRIAPSSEAEGIHAVTVEAVLLDQRPGAGGMTEFVLKFRDDADVARVLDVIGRGDLLLSPTS